MKEGLAGKIAKSFIGSKLTVLLMIVFMVVGVYSSFLIPREEEPQIDVPIADIFVGYPGVSPTEVESRVIKPLEKLISNIKGVEYVYSTSMKEQGMVIVPNLMVGGTDSSHFVAIAENVYRFNGVKINPESFSGFHGTNEYLPVAEYQRAINFYSQILLLNSGQ